MTHTTQALLERLESAQRAHRDRTGDMLFLGAEDPLLAEAISEIRRLEAENERLRENPAIKVSDSHLNDWRPIETAAKDGTPIVVANFSADPAEYEVGRYDPGYWTDFVAVGDGLYRKEKRQIYEWAGINNFHRATHWLPLPDTSSISGERVK